jgi:hypothetical protein
MQSITCRVLLALTETRGHGSRETNEHYLMGADDEFEVVGGQEVFRD